MKSILRDKIENIVDGVFLHGKNTPSISRQSQLLEGEYTVVAGTDSILKEVEKAMPKETTNEYWMKKLKVPSSDYSYGHMHGYNAYRDEMLKLLKEVKS